MLTFNWSAAADVCNATRQFESAGAPPELGNVSFIASANASTETIAEYSFACDCTAEAELDNRSTEWSTATAIATETITMMPKNAISATTEHVADFSVSQVAAYWDAVVYCAFACFQPPRGN